MRDEYWDPVTNHSSPVHLRAPGHQAPDDLQLPLPGGGVEAEVGGDLEPVFLPQQLQHL